MMKPNRKFDGVFSEFRRMLRVILLHLRRLPLSYCIGLGSFSLLLLELVAMLAFSLLRDMGVLSGLSPRAAVVIIIVTSIVAAVCMVSTVIGMVMLSFTKKSNHDKRLFRNENVITDAERRNRTPPFPLRSPLYLTYEDEISVLKENQRFLLGLLLFWLWVSWMLFGRRWFADDSIGERGFSIFFALCFTAFVSMEFIRLIRRFYNRLRCYRTSFKGLEGGKEDGTEK